MNTDDAVLAASRLEQRAAHALLLPRKGAC